MKQCELWNVLQNEDEHRLLDSADSKYDALVVTHIWALNNFAALFSNAVGVLAAGSRPRLCRPAGNGNPFTSQRKYAYKYGQVIHG